MRVKTIVIYVNGNKYGTYTIKPGSFTWKGQSYYDWTYHLVLEANKNNSADGYFHGPVLMGLPDNEQIANFPAHPAQIKKGDKFQMIFVKTGAKADCECTADDEIKQPPANTNRNGNNSGVTPEDIELQKWNAKQQGELIKIIAPPTDY